jgi:tetratricopeptide (TPR) repeat protein
VIRAEVNSYIVNMIVIGSMTLSTFSTFLFLYLQKTIGLLMKILLKIFAIFIILTNLEANNTIDSLKKEIRFAKSDSIKKSLYQDLLSYTTRRYPDKSIEFINQYKQFGESIDDPYIIYKAEQFRAISFARTGKINESNELLLELLPEVRDTKDQLLIARQLNLMGANYNRLGKYDKAAESLKESIEISKANDLNDLLGVNYIIMGILNSDIGNYYESEQFYKKAIEIYTILNDTEMLGLIYSNMASIYKHSQEYELALDYYNKSLEIDIAEADSNGIAITYHNIGANLYDMGEKKKGLEYLLLSKEIKKKLGNKISAAISDIALGEVYLNDKEFGKAIYYLKQAEKTFFDSGIGEKLLASYMLLDSTFRQVGDYKNAYSYLRKLFDLTDSMFTKEQTKIITELNAKFDVENKRKKMNYY